MMRVLMISMDRKIANQYSAVNRRMVEYAHDLGELHIVIFSTKINGLTTQKIAPNVWIHPTNSIDRSLYIIDAIRIGKKIITSMYFGETIITADDSSGTGISAAILKYFYKFPLQIQVHTDMWSSYYRYENILNWLRTLIAPFVLRYADNVRVVSEKIRQDVIDRAHVLKERVSVLPIFVDVLMYKDAPVTKDLHKVYPQWNNIILMSSRLTKEKDIPIALKVMRKLVKRYPQVGLVIVGSGPEELYLKKLVHRFKLGNNVAFEDWQDDLTSYFKTADIFLNTSIYEGYGMTLVEAGASGCAIVTTRVGVAFDLLDDGNNALLCDVKDGSSIYNKLVTLIENPTIRKSLGQEAQRDMVVSAMSRDEYVQKIQTLFKDLTKK